MTASAGSAQGGAADSAVRAQLRAYYQLDEPFPVQFGRYLAGLARLDLGWSSSRNAPTRT